MFSSRSVRVFGRCQRRNPYEPTPGVLVRDLDLLLIFSLILCNAPVDRRTRSGGRGGDAV